MAEPEIDLGEIADTFAELAVGPLMQRTPHPGKRVWTAFIIAAWKRHGDRATEGREEIRRLIAEAERLYCELPPPEPLEIQPPHLPEGHHVTLRPD